MILEPIPATWYTEGRDGKPRRIQMPKPDDVAKALSLLWRVYENAADAEAKLADTPPRRGRHPNAAVRDLIDQLATVWRSGVSRAPARTPGGPFVRLALASIEIAGLHAAPDTVLSRVRALRR